MNEEWGGGFRRITRSSRRELPIRPKRMKISIAAIAEREGEADEACFMNAG